MKYMKKITALLLVALLMVGVMPISVFAAAENTPKEEVVYINLNTDGTVKEIVVVNIFDLDEDGEIIDYGKYENLRNMTTNEKIGYANETVTIDAEAGKLYYEGKLDSKAMPWTIAIRYYMDGKEYSAGDIAGKSGDMKLTVQITENRDCIGNFFEGYALQATVTLDSEKCSNIHADGATIANVGRNKQLTYTILPNMGADIEITAKVTDFEMSSIAINGIKLNLNIEIDDTTIQNRIDEIIGAVKDLDDGVGKLKDGAGELSSGLAGITSKNNELLSGAYTAFEGICSASQIILNAELIKNGLQSVLLTPETYNAVLMELLQAMNADTVYNKAYQQALSKVTTQVEAQADALFAGYIMQNAEAIYLVYIQSQADEFIYTGGCAGCSGTAHCKRIYPRGGSKLFAERIRSVVDRTGKSSHDR